jgi:hypothetical protein
MLKSVAGLYAIRVLSWIVVAVSLLLIALTIVEAEIGKPTSDSNQYLTVMEAYAETGTPQLEAHREPLYQWMIYAAMRPFWDRPPGFEEDARSHVRWLVGVTQIGLFWLAVVLMTGFVARRGGVTAAAALLLLVAADRYDHQWIATVMSEGPAKIAFMFGALLLASFSLSGVGWKAVLGIVLVGLCPVFRAPDLSVALALAFGAGVYVLLAYRGYARFAGAAAVALFLVPALVSVQLSGMLTGFYGLSPVSSWLLAGRVLSITDPDALIRAGVNREEVDAIARKVYVGPPETSWTSIPETNDLNQADGLNRRIYPTNHKPVFFAALAWQEQRDGHADWFVACNILLKLASDAIKANPGPIFQTTMILWWEHATIPLIRNLTDHSWRNRLRLVFYFSIVVALGYFAWTARRGHPPAAWGWLAAATVFLPTYTLMSALGQNYQTKYGQHPYLFLGIMAYFAVFVSVFGRPSVRRDDVGERSPPPG